jgi:hypothetical protein
LKSVIVLKEKIRLHEVECGYIKFVCRMYDEVVKGLGLACITPMSPSPMGMSKTKERG